MACECWWHPNTPCCQCTGMWVPPWTGGTASSCSGVKQQRLTGALLRCSHLFKQQMYPWGHGAKTAGERCKGNGDTGGGTMRQQSPVFISFSAYFCSALKQTCHGQTQKIKYIPAFSFSGKNVKCMQAVFKMHIMFLIDQNCWSRSDLSVKYAFIHF